MTRVAARADTFGHAVAPRHPKTSRPAFFACDFVLVVCDAVRPALGARGCVSCISLFRLRLLPWVIEGLS